MIELQNRKQIRIKNYDYSQNGYYFVTLCTYERKPLFWKNYLQNAENNKSEIFFRFDASVSGDSLCAIDDIRRNVELSHIGEIVRQCWNNINDIYDNVKTDYYVVMPDHFHGIICINENKTGGQGRPPLPKIIQGFKSVTIRECFKYGCKKIWQRNYYEHVIRNDVDYVQTAEYILNNPLKYHICADN